MFLLLPLSVSKSSVEHPLLTNLYRISDFLSRQRLNAFGGDGVLQILGHGGSAPLHSPSARTARTKKHTQIKNGTYTKVVTIGFVH